MPVPVPVPVNQEIEFSEEEERIEVRRIETRQVKKIYNELVQCMEEEADRHLANWIKPEKQTPAEFEDQKKYFKEQAHKIRLSITLDGKKKARTMFSTELLDNLPEGVPIEQVEMTSIPAYEARMKSLPPNWVRLILDFSQPPLMDTRNLISDPTPNGSMVHIGGVDEAFRSRVKGIVNKYDKPRGWFMKFLHAKLVYDLGLYILGFPFAMYLCWKATGFIDRLFVDKHIVLSVGGYVYFFVIGLIIYRLLFGYMRWSFPLVELAENKKWPSLHRGVWSSLAIAIIGYIAWDVGGPALETISGWIKGGVYGKEIQIEK